MQEVDRTLVALGCRIDPAGRIASKIRILEAAGLTNALDAMWGSPIGQDPAGGDIVGSARAAIESEERVPLGVAVSVVGEAPTVTAESWVIRREVSR